MTRLQLKYSERSDLLKSATKKLRNDGKVPATMYGKKHDASSIAVDAEAVKLLLKGGGRLSVIDMKQEGKKSAQSVMIKDIQRHPISKNILHIDFLTVALDEPVHASVPIVTHGEAPGTKMGGILEIITSLVEIKALPTDIPAHIEVDVSEMQVGDHVTIADLTIPEGAEVLSQHTDAIVVAVRVPHVRVEEEPEAEEVEGEEAAETVETTGETTTEAAGAASEE